MCGIAGFINFGNNELLAKNACVAQCRRGPDAQDIWVKDNIALSHQRLSIIDLDSRSNQPFSKDGLVIVFNGEIYNYKDLKKQVLEIKPDTKFLTTSDTEVLLELYRIKKEKCLDDLIGMFAFAVYEIENSKLFITRDHFGIKPLYYTQIGNSFAFSSELKALVDIPGFDTTLNITALLGSINYLWVPGNESIFDKCFKVPPGHYMTLLTNNENKLTIDIKEYWKINNDISFIDENSTIQKLKKCIEGSIHRHMIADVPVSSFLSGGLDSSLISVLASRSNSDLSTYTIAINEKDKAVEQMPDDEKYAKLLAEKFHFNHHEIFLQPNIVNDLTEIVYALDEPIGDPAAINTYLICKAAREKGVKVLLSGMGADEIFFGYRRQKATLISLQYRKIPAFARNMLNTLSKHLPVRIGRRGIKFTRWLKRFISFANLPLEEAYMRSYSYYDEKELQQLFKIDISKSYQKLRSDHFRLFHKSYNNDPINQMCYTDIHLFMQGLNLSYTDKASMAASVEVRVPFIDKEVIQMAMQIKGSLKYKNRQSKYILKKVAEDYLPKDIIYRPKASFGAPIRSWISGDLREMIDDLLSRENIEKRGIFNYEYVRQLIEDDRKGLKDNAYRIYHLITLEIWLRRFVDKSIKNLQQRNMLAEKIES